MPPKQLFDVLDLSAALKALTGEGVEYRDNVNGDLNSDLILAQQELLLAIRQVTSFASQGRFKEALTACATVHSAEWCLGAEEKEWIETNAVRIRAMLRDISQTILKAQGHIDRCPKWCRVFWPSSGAEGASEEPHVSKKPAAKEPAPEGPAASSSAGTSSAGTPAGDGKPFTVDDVVAFSYDEMSHMAEATFTDGSKKHVRPRKNPETQPWDEAIADFGNGVKWMVAGLLNRELEHLGEVMASRVEG